MPVDLIQYAFVSGEVSPTLLGRTDFEKYDLGAELVWNWIVDYRGGLTTRPGFEFCDYVWSGGQPVKQFPFQFAPDEANNYVVIMGHNYARFVQDGAYVLEDGKAGTIASDGVLLFDIPGHGYASGDWIKVDGVGIHSNRTLVVDQVSGPLVTVYDPIFIDPIFAPVTTGQPITAYRIYTVNTGIPGPLIPYIGVSQIRDSLRITHTSFAPKSLIRRDHTDWVMETVPIGVPQSRPTNLSGTGKRSGTIRYLFGVTGVTSDGQEGPPQFKVTSGFNSDDEEHVSDYTLTYTWNGQSDFISYRLYRSNILRDVMPTGGESVGFVSEIVGTRLTETNAVPNFTRTPPTFRNPFAQGTIENVKVIDGGSGYTTDSTITIGGGTGFVGQPVVVDGEITGVRIISRGRGYTESSPVTVSDGTGAQFELTVTPLSGTFPAISARFQQRQIYAASLANPMTVWGSRPRYPNNFDETDAQPDNDPFEFELDSEVVAPIKHMVSSRSGLLLMSQAGVWQLSGGSSDAAVTPRNALATPHLYTGVSDLQPIRIDTDILFAEPKAGSVRMLTYVEYTRTYQTEDVSLLSNHFFTADNPVVRWTYAESPFKAVWAPRQDGSMLAFTTLKEQKVYAWTQLHTQGYFRDVVSVQDAERDNIYVLTERIVEGRPIMLLERQVERNPTTVEDAWAVDAGLRYVPNVMEVELLPFEKEGQAVPFFAPNGTFTEDHVGWVIRGVKGGKAVITTFVDSDEVLADILQPFTKEIPEDPHATLAVLNPGEWTLDEPFDSVAGLWHLEGKTVSILADGSVMAPRRVENGMIELDAPVTRLVVGLGYKCIAKMLPPTVSDAVIEARRKATYTTHVRLHESRGLKAGNTMDKLYDIQRRTTELYGEPIQLQSGIRFVSVEPQWDYDSSVYYVQEEPLPATLLWAVKSLEVGDDPN